MCGEVSCSSSLGPRSRLLVACVNASARSVQPCSVTHFSLRVRGHTFSPPTLTCFVVTGPTPLLHCHGLMPWSVTGHPAQRHGSFFQVSRVMPPSVADRLRRVSRVVPRSVTGTFFLASRAVPLSVTDRRSECHGSSRSSSRIIFLSVTGHAAQRHGSLVLVSRTPRATGHVSSSKAW